MAAKPYTVPEIRCPMTSFALMPRHNAGVMRMASDDIMRMKNFTKAKNALRQCSACRVQRTDARVTIEFLDKSQPDETCVRVRFIYELTAPFA